MFLASCKKSVSAAMRKRISSIMGEILANFSDGAILSISLVTPTIMPKSVWIIVSTSGFCTFNTTLSPFFKIALWTWAMDADASGFTSIL